MAPRSGKQSDKPSQDVVDYCRTLIDQQLAAGAETLLPDGLPPRSPDELLALASAQGVRPVTNPEQLLGDFWPEEESVDDFLEARRH